MCRDSATSRRTSPAPWRRGPCPRRRRILLFGLPDSKDEQGSSAGRRRPGAEHIREMRSAPGAAGHDRRLPLPVHLARRLRRPAGGKVDNDATLPLLARAALSHARAGADVVAPSDMMDGRVAASRTRSTARASRHRDLRLQHQVRLGLLRPVPRRSRLCAKSGDRKGYQLDPANAREAVREALLDASEGPMR